MAKVIVPRNQQLTMAAEHPKPTYSRVVGLLFQVPKDGTQTQWDTTEPLGQNLWVLRTQLWFKAETPGVSRKFNWRVCITGPGAITGGQVMTDLEQLVRMRYPGKPYATWVGSDVYFDFQMMLFFEGLTQRLVLFCYNDSRDDPLWAQAAFTISEG